MQISIGSDHRGLQMKTKVIEVLRQLGHEVQDMGTHSTESCDYPDIAEHVAHNVSCKLAERGILICGTGIGMQITANKFPGVRAATCQSGPSVASSNDPIQRRANVLDLSRVLRPALRSLA